LGYDQLLKTKRSLVKIWEMSDITIEGDAQQGIHLQLNQTYLDSRLNIGPKGFTGEKYGGSTYWTEVLYSFIWLQKTNKLLEIY
jgi:maltose phosphorylase